MELRQVVAIVPSLMLDEVEKKLKEIGVSGLSTTRVKGYGEYSNFFSRDRKVLRARVDVFAEKRRAEQIAHAIADAAHTGSPGDGLVAILPVERVIRIRTRRDATADELH